MTRSCESCKSCCTLLGVEAINKPDGYVCINLCSIGCVIYEKRPDECRLFECAWLAGLGSEIHRPDRCGVVLTVPLKDIEVDDVLDVPRLVAYSDGPEVFETELVRNFLGKLSEGAVIIFKEAGTVIGPPEQVQKLREFLDLNCPDHGNIRSRGGNSIR